ncbi:MAG: DUF5996 family protein [Pseudomonadota bacterium]|nr:DUF5996 family protein [Pseudomonadota bacterium]
MKQAWPDIPYQDWRETCAALHLFTQIVGKYRLARTPWVNHSWHATLTLDGSGLTTGPVPDAAGSVGIRFDLLDHALIGRASDGRSGAFDLTPMTVAEFYGKFAALLGKLGATASFNRRPNEVSDPVAFDQDHAPRPYDAAAVERFFRALTLIDGVLKRFRTGFIGKASPVHLFWGSFDLAVTRFSGRTAPEHPGGVPALPDAVAREAYSHEVSSAGFWPGGGLSGIEYPAFYSYAYPAPPGFGEAKIEPKDAVYSAELGEYLLPYDAVRTAPDPEAALLAFLQSTYRAAADLGGWDRAALECSIGEPLRPRPSGQFAKA